MSRAVVAGVVVSIVALSACSGADSASSRFGASPACPILAKLAQSGQAVADTDVTDPAEFNAKLRVQVARYVRVAEGLKTAVPVNLRDDVDRMIAAAQQHRFDTALGARAHIDEYAHSECNTAK